jgi:hypothetical protein
MGYWIAKKDIQHLSRPPSQTEANAAASTSNIIRTAVKKEGELQHRNLDIFLQGSYANSTNISGGSDVDVVSKLEETFYYDYFSDVTEFKQKSIGESMTTPVEYQWSDYRADLLLSLKNQFGSAVTDGKKAISIEGTPSGSRLPADVIPCVAFRMYRNNHTYEEGICFFPKDSIVRIANFPKQHRENMSNKNSTLRSGPKFKGIVRAFKRLRDEIDPTGNGLKSISASYWIECLLYNVPDGRFAGSYEDAFLGCLSYLYGALDDTNNSFMQANDIYYLFHSSFWNREHAKTLVNQIWDYTFDHVS